MPTDENKQEDIASPETSEEVQAETPSVEALQKELETLKATVGSTKRELKDAKKALDDAKKALNPEPQKEQQSGEPDYGRIALLNSVQVTHPDDQKVVMDEAARLKLPLTDVLRMEHIQAKLKTARDTRESQDGMPKGSGRTTGNTKADVEYYLEHPEEAPEDPALAYKVIDAKMKRETDANKFSAELYTG